MSGEILGNVAVWNMVFSRNALAGATNLIALFASLFLWLTLLVYTRICNLLGYAR